MVEAPFDLQRAHRWFGVECNNNAWDLLEKPNRTSGENEQLIHLAHAACLHWKEVGTPVNHQRAQILLANVYARLGEAHAAMRHAKRTLELMETNGDEQTIFDRATSYACAARAYACNGDKVRARELKQTAIEYADQMTDPEEKEVFDKMCKSDDWYGVE